MPGKFREIARTSQYHPGLVSLFINPFHIARKGLFENILGLSGSITGKTLDVGCGQKPYEKLFGSTQYIGLEIDTDENRRSKNADFFYDGISFPFQDSEFDSVVTNQVFEHVFHPDRFLREINRVLKVGGILLMTVPFVWDEHEQPFDFARYSSFGLEAMLKNHGFEILENRKSVADIRVIFQLINAYIYKKTVTGNRYVDAILTAILMSPFNIVGEILSKILPGNEDLYLDNILLAKKPGSPMGDLHGA